jgi:hypothetical protein
LYPESPPVSVPTHVKNYPRFNEVQQKAENLESEDVQEVEKIKENMKITKEKLNNLKRELEYLKNNNNTTSNRSLRRLDFHIRQNSINSTNISYSFDSNKIKNGNNMIDDIVKKYSVHNGENELAVFEKIFKNFTSTNTNHVDIKKIKEEIHENINNQKIQNILNENNSINLNKRVYKMNSENLAFAQTSNIEKEIKRTKNINRSLKNEMKSKLKNGVLNLNPHDFFSIK